MNCEVTCHGDGCGGHEKENVITVLPEAGARGGSRRGTQGRSSPLEFLTLLFTGDVVSHHTNSTDRS